MNDTINTPALFIKRAEEYQTKEFIIQVFNRNNIGTVSDVIFIKKQNDSKPYNGAIVIFEKWNINSTVERLFDEMSSSVDKTTKFYFNCSRYWIITVHQKKLPECDKKVLVDTALPDQERIRQLEDLVQTMAAKIYYLETVQQQNERRLMDSEYKDMRRHMCNIELISQIEDNRIQQKCSEDNFNQEIQKLRTENQDLLCRLAISAVKTVHECHELQNECHVLEQKIKEQKCILDYTENQTKEMQKLLIEVSDEDPIKPVINTFIEEYCYVSPNNRKRTISALSPELLQIK